MARLAWPKLVRRALTDERPPGSAPGTLLDQGATEHRARVDIVAYGPEEVESSSHLSLGDVGGLRERFPVVWVNVVGVEDTKTLEALSRTFGIHHLILEDIQHTIQRPKTEEHEQLVFCVLPMPDDDGQLEQMSIVLGQGFVITFNERPGDCFSQVRKRMSSKGSRLRAHGADYLANAFIDAIVDHYAPVLDRIYEEIDDLETMTLHRPAPELLAKILLLRKRLVAYRKVARPMVEAISALLDEEEYEHIQEATLPFIRDAVDHASRIVDTVDAQRELAAGLLELHQGRSAHEANESMRVLTIIATVFIPLSFIAGLYGMNFERTSPWNMPELGWTYGYPFALGLMAFAAAGLLGWLWRMGWLTRPSPPDEALEDGR